MKHCLKKKLSFLKQWLPLLCLLLGFGMAVLGQRYFDQSINFHSAILLYGLGIGFVLICLHNVREPITLEPPTVIQPSSKKRLFVLSGAILFGLLGAIFTMHHLHPKGSLLFYLLSIAIFISAFININFKNIYRLQIKWEALIIIGILSLALILRVYHVESIPPGFWGDEANDAIEAQEVLQGHFQTPFTRDWGGNPAMKAFVNALSFLVFGQTIFGIRVVAAIAGTLSILATYLLGKELFGHRAALLASIFMTISRWHIHRSRYDSIVMLGVPFQVFGYYFLLKGLRTKQDKDFALSGLLLGFSLNFYHGSRIAPIIIVALILFEVFRAGFPFLRRYFRQLVVFLLAIFIITAQLGIFYLNNPRALFGRATGVWVLNNQAHLQGMYGPRSNLEYVLLQARDTFLMFNISGDPNPLVNWQRKPMVDSLTAIFLVLGVVYGLWCWRERRYFFLLIWFFLTLLMGSILTIGAPNGSRTVGVIPAVMLFVGVGFDLIWLRMQTVLNNKYWQALIVFFVLIFFLSVSYINLTIYQQYVADPGTWSSFGGQQVTLANYLKTTRPNKTIYFLANPTINSNNKIMKFISGGFEGKDIWDSTGLIPINKIQGQEALYILPNNALIPSLNWFYPGAITQIVKDPSGRDSFTAFQVSSKKINQQKGLVGRYFIGADWQGVPVMDKKETIFSFDWSTQAPLPLPFSVEWQGTLFVDQTGYYTFQVESENELQVILDRAHLLTTNSADTNLSRDVFLLNRGFHPIIIRCRVLQPGIVRFFWKPKANDIQKDTSASFYTLPISVGLMGRYYNNIDWVGEPKLQQIDPFLYFHWERDTLDPLPGTFSVEWRGVLHVAKAGVYVFDIFSCGNSSLQIDNQVVINSDGFHWLEYREGNINLVEGEHDITIRHAFKQGPRVLEVHWAPPGEQKEIISAWLLTPL